MLRDRANGSLERKRYNGNELGPEGLCIVMMPRKSDSNLILAPCVL
jgi:hypothetical protein